MTEELIELCAHFHDALWRLLLDDHITDFMAIGLPVRFRNVDRTIKTSMGGKGLRILSSKTWAADNIRLHFQCFKDEQSFPKVSFRILSYLLNDTVVIDSETLTISNMLHDLHHLKEEGKRTQLRPEEWRRTSASVGAATLMSKHRLFIGAMSLLVLFAQRMIRIFDIYFSIVRRRAA